jgi:hypothetical protein
MLGPSSNPATKPILIQKFNLVVRRDLITDHVSILMMVLGIVDAISCGKRDAAAASVWDDLMLAFLRRLTHCIGCTESTLGG